MLLRGIRPAAVGLTLACLLAGAAGAPAQAPPAAPAVVLRATKREGHAAPVRQGSARTGGGALTVTQPSPDTLLVTLTGAAAAKANPCQPSLATLEANLEQHFEVAFPAGVKPARLVLEARLLGLLRGEGKKGGAELVQATAGVHHGPQPLATVALGPKAVAGCDALAVHLAEGPVCVPVGPGCHALHLGLRLSAAQGKALCPHIASAEFAPPPALPPAWVHEPDPFAGLDRSGLGFQVVVRVEPLPEGAAPAKKDAP